MFPDYYLGADNRAQIFIPIQFPRRLDCSRDFNRAQIHSFHYIAIYINHHGIILFILKEADNNLSVRDFNRAQILLSFMLMNIFMMNLTTVIDLWYFLFNFFYITTF
jgi:hypothetical protein